jgi:Barrel-sandwich domain of CusB or HlyD membrane-fusion
LGTAESRLHVHSLADRRYGGRAQRGRGPDSHGLLQAPTIFTIAQDLSKMCVYTKLDESDVGNIKVGKPVRFKVDAFPKNTFQGVVSQVRMNATTVQSVVTYDTIIEFANRELKLPEEVASLALYLCSDEVSFLTSLFGGGFVNFRLKNT